MENEIYSRYLRRDASESERLDLQHQLMEKLIGHQIHPEISADLPSSPVIADIATGTGIKLKDLSKLFPPTSILEGFDISDAQFPPKDMLPANIHLSVADAKQPFPAKYHGKYDLVTLRFLAVAMKPDDWTNVARNLWQLLKPGGWIQWIEPDLSPAIPFYRTDLSVSAPASTAGLEGRSFVGALSAGTKFGCDELGGILRSETVGFEEVRHEKFSTDRIAEDRPAWSLNGANAIESAMAWEEEAKGEDGMSRQQVKAHMDEVREESRKGAVYCRFDIHMFIGRKR